MREREKGGKIKRGIREGEKKGDNSKKERERRLREIEKGRDM